MKSLILAAAAALLLVSPALAKHGDGGNSATGIGIGTSSASNNNRQSTSFNQKYQAPGMGMDGASPNSGCKAQGVRGGVISIPWGGLGAHWTTNDEVCKQGMYLDMIGQAGFGRRVQQQWLINTVPGLSDAVFRRPVKR